MKINSDKCHLFISGHKFEHLWAKIGDDKIRETGTIKLFIVSHVNLLDSHVSIYPKNDY